MAERPVMASEDVRLLDLFECLALKAGDAILQHYKAGFTIETKPDSSPVTKADQEAERIILDGLKQAACFLPCVAEEEASAGILPQCGDEFLLIDPLDGTREFIDHKPDFTVNIALIRNGVPVVGVVYAPARNLLYSGRFGYAGEMRVESGQIVERNELRVKTASNMKKPRILASRSHNTSETDDFIRRYQSSETLFIGSSLKFCMLARGDAEIYPRFGPTMQWDTAAGDAVLRAAGGKTLKLDGTDLTYGPNGAAGLEQFLNPYFIATAAGFVLTQ